MLNPLRLIYDINARKDGIRKDIHIYFQYIDFQYILNCNMQYTFRKIDHTNIYNTN